MRAHRRRARRAGCRSARRSARPSSGSGCMRFMRKLRSTTCAAAALAASRSPASILTSTQDVVAPFVVDEWRRFPQRIRHGHDRRQRLELHLDARGEILGFGRGRGQRHRDRLADMAHLAGGEDRPIRRLKAGQICGRAHAADTGKITGEKDALLRALRLAHRDDARVRVRRSARTPRAACRANRCRRRTGRGLARKRASSSRGSRAPMPNSRPIAILNVPFAVSADCPSRASPAR